MDFKINSPFAIPKKQLFDFAAIVAMFIATLLNRSIVVSPQRVERRAAKTACGDLTGNTIEDKNELTPSNQLLATTKESNQGMESQPTEPGHLPSPMNEMSATVQEITRHGRIATTAADGAGAQELRSISDSMQGISALTEGIENAGVVINKLLKRYMLILTASA